MTLYLILTILYVTATVRIGLVLNDRVKRVSWNSMDSLGMEKAHMLV